MEHYIASKRSGFSKIPGRQLVYIFYFGSLMRSFRGKTLQEAYVKAKEIVGKRPDRFTFQHYAVRDSDAR